MPEEPVFRLLGAMQIRSGEVEVDGGPTKLQAVLAVLLLSAGEAVSIEDLLSRVWGDTPPAASLVHVYISRIRDKLKPLGVGVRKTGDGYTIDVDPLLVDVHLFGHLMRQATRYGEAARHMLDDALELWRGVPFARTDSLWLREHGATLRQQWFEACLSRNRAWLDAGLHVELLDVIRGLVTRHFTNERLAEQYMVALYRAGDVGQALAHYRKLTKRLLAQEARQPSPLLQSLHLRMLHQDPSLTLGAPAAAAPVAPSTLVPALGSIVGRGTELGQLNGIFEADQRGSRNSVRLVGIFGPPGVGKTTLAVGWAHRIKGRYPGGCLQADLGAFGPAGTAETGQVLDEFLTALGVAPARIPPDTLAKRALYRTLAERRPVLVLLDNVAAAEQVAQLMPTAPGSLVIVTSRRRLGGLVARNQGLALNLGLLNLDDSVELLREYIRPARESADVEFLQQIARCCGGLPLAITLAGAGLALRAGQELSALAAELTDRSSVLSALDADADSTTAVQEVFRWSYDALPQEPARLFRLLSLHPGDGVTPYAAAALGGIEPARANLLLRELAEANLIRPIAHERYAMHNLMALYAAQLVESTDGPADRDEAITSVLGYYLSTASAAMDVLMPDERERRPRVDLPDLARPPLPDPASALAWLDGERTSLLATTVHAEEHGRPEYLLKLAVVLFRYLDHGGFLTDALTLNRAALRTAEALGDRAGEAEALLQLGSTLTRFADFEEAKQLLGRSVDLFTERGDDLGLARALGTLGRISWRQGANEDAIGQQLYALELLARIDDRIGQARTLTNLGAIHESMNDLDKAMLQYRAAQAICEELRSGDALARAWGSLAGVHQRRGELDVAVRLHGMAGDAFRKLGDRVGEATAMTNLGTAQGLLGQHYRAVELHEEALTRFREIGDRRNEIEVLNNLGEALMDCGHADHARSRHAEAMRFAESSGDQRELGRAYAGLAAAHRASGEDPELVRHQAAAAQAIFAALGLPDPDRLTALLARLA
ncbi:AfsR/SARP family transcriptional regulator [Allocatelliglobosispora scoriae]|nr:tetratricopeptide repeat protein [Allocatelliglobosispora scoriae]